MSCRAAQRARAQLCRTEPARARVHSPQVTFLWFYIGALISLYIFAPTIFIWSAYTACFTLVFSLALRIPFLQRLSHELSAVHKGAAAEAADGAASAAAVRPEV